MIFDPVWPHGHKTRSGLKARIIATNLKSRMPIVAVLTEHDGNEEVHQFWPNGRFDFHGNRKTSLDLVNAEPVVSLEERRHAPTESADVPSQA